MQQIQQLAGHLLQSSISQDHSMYTAIRTSQPHEPSYTILNINIYMLRVTPGWGWVGILLMLLVAGSKLLIFYCYFYVTGRG